MTPENSALHSAFRGQPADEMHFGTGDAVPTDLRSHAAAPRQARVAFNRAVPTDIVHFRARVVVTPTAPRIVLEELSGFSERPMIMVRMTTASVRSSAMTIGSAILFDAPGT